MPYNTSAIPPRKQPTGQTQLPLSRVRKIIALDPDVAVCSSNAAFVITLATELFIQYLAGEAQTMVKLDRKPRRNVQYRDLAQAVSRIDSLEFLEDTIPQTVSYGKVKADAAAAQAKLRSNGRVDVEGGGGGLPTGGSGGGGGGGASSAGRGGAGGAHGKSSRSGRSSTGGAAAAADEAAAATTSGGRKKQQVLSFNILNHGDDDRHGHASFRSARGGGGGGGGGGSGGAVGGGSVSGGVAAAAALAQAAAASGASSMALDEAAGPDAQLEQDMRRMRKEEAVEKSGGDGEDGEDVRMLDG